MLNTTYWVIVLLLTFSIFELLRRKVLREKYATVWLMMALIIVAGSLFPNIVNEISKKLGFQYLSNFVLFFFAIINMLIAMQLSLSIGKAENQIQNLAEEIALLNQKINK
jgi:hypothetical protein